jgi:catalase
MKLTDESGNGRGWVDDARTETYDALAARVGAQQAKIAAARPELSGQTGRGQHQKQLLGAFATLQLDGAAPGTARVGPFAGTTTFKVACRISNGQPCPYHDQAADVRGVAVKFFTAAGVETDLVMTNEGGRSHARDAAQFMDVADLLIDSQVQHGALEVVRDLSKDLLTGRLGPLEAARIAAILGKETLLHHVESMATERYWGSVVAVEGRAAKYSFHPHPSAPSGTRADPSSPNYLRDDLLNRIAEGGIRFQLGVQWFIDEKTTPVNDASIVWDAPITTLGTLTIDATPPESDERLVDRMAYNPAHGFEPLGITRARREVYAASAKNRGALGTDEIRRYFGL